MRLKRKIDEYLREWKKSKNKMPLIVKGARQIGKTESGVRIDIWTHFMRGCIIDYVH